MNPGNNSVERKNFYMICVTLKHIIYLHIFSAMSASSILCTGGNTRMTCSDSSCTTVKGTCLVIVNFISIAIFQKETMDSRTIIYT